MWEEMRNVSKHPRKKKQKKGPVFFFLLLKKVSVRPIISAEMESKSLKISD